MKSFVASLALAAAVSAIPADMWKQEFDDFESLDHKAIFGQWKDAFNREYTGLAQEAEKYAIFLENLAMIVETNSQNLSFKLRLNQFGDMNKDQFREYVHGGKGSCLQPPGSVKPNPIAEVAEVNANPTSIDWTTKGVVTPVKNQGQCGSCWAFATTGSLECRYAIAQGTLNSLSEQQLVDCSTSYGNYGCDGGWWYNAYEYIEATGGLCTEAEYPYTATDGTCKASTCGTLYDKMTDYAKVPADNGADLETATAAGCVAVGIEADQSAFQFYSSGVLTGTCGTSIDHGVLVVGYGTLSGVNYWKVKNSWGTSWGMQGFVDICKDCNKNGAEGECGINMYPAYPNQF
jgi:C1A family cysteine protease